MSDYRRDSHRNLSRSLSIAKRAPRRPGYLGSEINRSAPVTYFRILFARERTAGALLALAGLEMAIGFKPRCLVALCFGKITPFYFLWATKPQTRVGGNVSFGQKPKKNMTIPDFKIPTGAQYETRPLSLWCTKAPYSRRVLEVASRFRRL